MTGPRNQPYTPIGLAILAFLGHAPGLKIFARVRFSRRFVWINSIAIALTLGSMATAALLAPSGAQGLWVFATWVVLHFLWSVILSVWILADESWRDDMSNVERCGHAS